MLTTAPRGEDRNDLNEKRLVRCPPRHLLNVRRGGYQTAKTPVNLLFDSMEQDTESLQKRYTEKREELAALQQLRDYSAQLVTALETTYRELERDTKLLERMAALSASVSSSNGCAYNKD